jgi:hypothetical protein
MELGLRRNQAESSEYRHQHFPLLQQSDVPPITE